MSLNVSTQAFHLEKPVILRQNKSMRKNVETLVSCMRLFRFLEPAFAFAICFPQRLRKLSQCSHFTFAANLRPQLFIGCFHMILQL